MRKGLLGVGLSLSWVACFLSTFRSVLVTSTHGYLSRLGWRASAH